MNSLLTLSSFIFPLITFPYVSRILLPTGTGKVAFATSIVSYFTMFAQLGIPTYGIRACAKVRDNKDQLTKTAQELYIINWITTIISYAMLLLATVIIPRLYAEKYLIMIVSLNLLLTTLGMEWLFKALEQYSYITIRSLFAKLISLVALFLFVHQKDDYIIYGGISVLAASASNIMNILYVHKYISLKPVGGYEFKRHLKPVLVFFAMSCAITIYTYLDTVMLGFMIDDTEVGYYNAAVKIKSILVSFVTALGAVLLPRVSYYFEKGNYKDFIHIVQKAMSFIILFAVPLMIYFIIFAKEGILLLSGDSFYPSITPMRIIMPTILLIGITNVLGMQVLVPMGYERIVLLSVSLGAAADLVFNFLLIPRLGSIGASIGTVIAEFVVLLTQLLFLRNYMAGLFEKVNYKSLFLSLLPSLLICMGIKPLHLNSFASLLLSSILFFGFYCICLYLMKEEIMIESINQIHHKIKTYKHRV